MNKKERGMTVVEFALVFPLALLLFFAIIEFAILLYDQQIITYASRVGARSGTVLIANQPRIPSATIIDNTINAAKNHLITFGSKMDPTVCLRDCVEPSTGHCKSGCASAAICTSYNNPSDGLQVNINYTYTYGLIPGLFRFSFGNSLTPELVLRASTTMRCE